MNNVLKVGEISFPKFSGIRCLMMPYIQGDPDSVPKEYAPYKDIIENTFIKKGDIGYLTIDESFVKAGSPHRGDRARTDRALHTEVGVLPGKIYAWGGGGWATNHMVTLRGDVEDVVPKMNELFAEMRKVFDERGS